MTFKSFYLQTPLIKLYEPLFDLFAVNSNGDCEFSFIDAVKIAGHACPTVAGAYLMTYHGLRALYAEETPLRGNIQLLFSDKESAGVTGVIANVMSSIVGAAGIGGFKGIGGHFNRQNNLLFEQVIPSQIAMKRIDSEKIVHMTYCPEIIPYYPELSFLLPKVLNNSAKKEEEEEFKRLWNLRLEKILIAGSTTPNKLIKMH